MEDLSHIDPNSVPQSTEQLLKESEARFRLLVDSVRDYAIFMLNRSGIITTWNIGAEKIKGYTKEEIIGQHFSIFYTAEDKARDFPSYELTEAIRVGRFEDEGWRVKKNGDKMWANVVITPIYNARQEHIGFSKVTRDLTERVRNEALMKKNKELHRVNTDLDNFIYTASHDLKTPISNLEGLLSLVKTKINPKLDASEKKIIQMMDTAVLKLNDTIESLVDITKTQKNLEAKPEQILLDEVIADVKEDLAGKIMQSKALFKIAFEVQEMNFPKASIRSILFNLVSNAIKYRSPDRRPVIQITSTLEGEHIVLSVKDNGLGLTEAQTAKLFSMFTRFHTHVEGSGVGLYIVKRTMENHGGQIRVLSRLNEGTEFLLYFNKTGLLD